MAAIDFPSNPVVGSSFTAAGVTWVWDGVKWYMSALTGGGGGTPGGGGASITVSDNPPINPVAGALWFNSAVGQLYVYYNDGNSSQWVVVVNAGAGIGDAPQDSSTYGRNTGGWVHLTHTDITDWTTSLAPYALTTSVPVASSTTPLMDGTAAIGTGTTWARADHRHPTDTSRAAQTSLASYLPLAGGTVTGALSLNGAVSIPGGQIVISPGAAGGPNPVIWLTDGSTNRTAFYFNVSTGATTLSDQYSGSNIGLLVGGGINLNPTSSQPVTVSGSLSVTSNATISGTATISYATINGTLGVGQSASVTGAFTWGGVGSFGNGGGQVYWDGGSYSYLTCPPYSSNIGVGANISLSPQSGANMLLQVGHGYQAGLTTWTILSDDRIKTIESDYTIGLEEIIQLRPVNYIYKGNDTPTANKSALRVEDIDPENPDAPIPAEKLVTEAPYPTSMHYHFAKERRSFVGLVAQEAEISFPGIISKKSGFIDGVEVNDFRHLNASDLTFALINAVKELAARVSELEAR